MINSQLETLLAIHVTKGKFHYNTTNSYISIRKRHSQKMIMADKHLKICLISLFVFFFFGCIGSSLWCTGFSLPWLLLLQSTDSRRTGFSNCGSQAQQFWLVGSRAQAQQLWHTGLVASQHVGSSQTRARTRVPCTGRRIHNHCANREVPYSLALVTTYDQIGRAHV